MKKEEIVNIAKELILISAKFKKKLTKKETELLFKKFDDYEKKLKKDTTKYSETILSFVIDLKNDLKSWRELNIDKLSTDEYLENYLLTKNEVNIYNSLISNKSYRNIFNILNLKMIDNKKIELELDELIKIYNLNINKINTEIIAKNLLIFTLFKRNIPKKYLINLYLNLEDNKQKNKVLELIKTWNILIEQVKKYSIKYYKKENFNYKYIWFTNLNWKSILADKVIDCSKVLERTGFPKKEYLKLVKSL